jgi:carboxypeptidase PM20D1
MKGTGITRHLRERLKRIAQVACALLVLLLLGMVVRAASLSSRQPVVGTLNDAPVDGPKVAAHLASAIRFKTVAESIEIPAPGPELDALRTYLEETYPKVHSKLVREIVGGHALLFTWKGQGPESVILCAHQDVVPIEPGTEGKWEKPAFDGVQDPAFVWGRGALDDKGSVIAILEAVEALLAAGFEPKRTVYLAFGHDEEIAGTGAAKIVELLASRGVKAEAALDEGNPVVEGIVPSISLPVAPIGIAEKGYLTVKLSIDLPGGHSSTPTEESAIGVLSQAALRVQTHPFPAHFDGATARFFEWAAPEMSFWQRMVLGNTWLTSPVVTRVFAKAPALDASIRTTTALTVFRSGVKDNVIPRTAEAQVNFRVLPGDSTESVLAHVRSVVDDARVRIEPQNATRREPTSISRTDGPVWSALATTVREVFPGAVVAPALFLGGTDGRQYARVAKDVYRFLPVKMTSMDVGRIHGTDERIATTSLVDAVRFYRRLIDVLAR